MAADSATADATTAQQDDLAIESSAERFVPYYSELRAPGETQASFKLLRPFVPFSTDDSKRNLQAFMTASSDPQIRNTISAGKMKINGFGELGRPGIAASDRIYASGVLVSC